MKESDRGTLENGMNGLLLCALLAMAALAQAENVVEGGITPGTGEFSPQHNSRAAAEDRLLIAQVAAETAQLMPRSKPEIAPPKVTRKASRPARAQSHGQSRALLTVPVRNYKPAPVKSRFLSSAEQFAKANGCAAPVTKMNFAVTGGAEAFETFTASCGSNKPMSIRCDSTHCQPL